MCGCLELIHISLHDMTIATSRVSSTLIRREAQTYGLIFHLFLFLSSSVE
jgi:hypothetical protein